LKHKKDCHSVKKNLITNIKTESQGNSFSSDITFHTKESLITDQSNADKTAENTGNKYHQNINKNNTEIVGNKRIAENESNINLKAKKLKTIAKTSELKVENTIEEMTTLGKNCINL
jgi:hypothetical protein